MSAFDDEEDRITRTPRGVEALLAAAERVEVRGRPGGRVLRRGPERLLEATRAVLAEREAELLELKGPCRAPGCPLHQAHRGPCTSTWGGGQ